MRFWRIYYRLGQFGKEMVHNKGGKMLNRQVYVSDNIHFQKNRIH